MIHELIHLDKQYQIRGKATLEVFISDNTDSGLMNKPALIIVPGGGYGFISRREADPIAFKFLLLGYNCFVLTYSTSKEFSSLYPQPQIELACAYDYVKNHAKELYIEKENVFLVGFSAGGHLVGSFSLYYKEYLKFIKSKIIDRPKGICLAYPVISSTDTHKESIESITNNYVPELVDKMSIEKNINKDFPPTFIWTTEDDTCVPPSNTYRMVEALDKNGVKEIHYIFKKGDHGLSIATPFVGTDVENIDKEIQSWPNICDEFFKKI